MKYKATMYDLKVMFKETQDALRKIEDPIKCILLLKSFNRELQELTNKIKEKNHVSRNHPQSHPK